MDRFPAWRRFFGGATSERNFAARFELPLLHRDRDFEHIAKVEPRLKLLVVKSDGETG
jgi:hypothetical protein